MSSGIPPNERNRARIGLAVLLLGVLLLIYVWSSWLYRSTQPRAPSVGVNTTAPSPPAEAVTRTMAVRRALPLFVVVASVLLLAFVAAVYLLLRGGRLLRANRNHSGQPKPSIQTDAWATHKLPEDHAPERGADT